MFYVTFMLFPVSLYSEPPLGYFTRKKLDQDISHWCHITVHAGYENIVCPCFQSTWVQVFSPTCSVKGKVRPIFDF